MRTKEIVIAKVVNIADMKRFLKRLKMRGNGFVIKPNWSNANTFTSAKMLELLFNCFKGDTCARASKIFGGYKKTLISKALKELETL